MTYILWDFDETIAYREGDWAQTIGELLEIQGITDFNIKDIDNQLQSGFPWHHYNIPQTELFKGKDYWEYLQSLFIPIFESYGIEDERSKRLARQVKNQFLKIDKWHIYDDVINTLNIFQTKNYTQLILSNHIPELGSLISELGISHYFESIYTSGIVGYNKPNKLFFEHVLKNIPFSSLKIMIGDNYLSDVLGAEQVGIKCILVRSSNLHGYKYYLKDLRGISEYLCQVLNE